MPVLLRAAELWAKATHLGRPQNDADLIIAATALHHGLTVVTGDAAEFERAGALVENPWT